MSERLREGSLRAVFHGAPEILTLKELVCCYHNLVEDGTRVMLRIKAIYRGRAIATPGVSVYLRLALSELLLHPRVRRSQDLARDGGRGQNRRHQMADVGEVLQSGIRVPVTLEHQRLDSPSIEG